MACGKSSMKKSIITEYVSVSVLTGLPAECMHHLICGNGLRKLADADGLVIPLTHFEHNIGNSSIHHSDYGMMLSRIVGQLAWEKEYYRSRACKDDPARLAFRERYGISYL